MKKKLLDRFDQLSTGEKDILLALSVIYAPIGQTRLKEFLKISDCVPIAVANIIARPLRQKLEKLELIETTNAGWICSREIAEVLIKKAAANKVFFEKLALVVLQDSGYSSYHLMHLQKIRLLRVYLYQGKERQFIWGNGRKKEFWSEKIKRPSTFMSNNLKLTVRKKREWAL